MRICFVPIDNRPVCYNLAKDIAAMDEDIELLLPPREFLGDLTKTANIDKILDWMQVVNEGLGECDCFVLSLDTIAYGGLIPSRRSNDSLDDIKSRLERLKPILEGKKVYAFSSIMRISNNNYNEEEKEYWSEWGKKIFEYSYNYGGLPYDKPSSQPSPPERESGKRKPNAFYASPLAGERIFGRAMSSESEQARKSIEYGDDGKIREDLESLECSARPNNPRQAERSPDEGGSQKIPFEILLDYLATRIRNFEINKMYLNMNFDTLIFSKDDCAERGFNVDEARELERLGGITKTGADEIPLTLLARAIEKEIKVFVEFTEPEHKDKISNYEDVSIEKSVEGQIELAGLTRVFTPDEADIILIVNNFIEKQGELVMGWTTKPYQGQFTPPDKPYAIADVRYANGADNAFVEQILPKLDDNFYGYAGWNTSANTLGTILATVKVKYGAEKYNHEAFKKLQMIRFLDDWAYQANVRINGQTPDIKDLMKPFEKRLTLTPPLSPGEGVRPDYSYPWNRSFEVEVNFSFDSPTIL